MNSWTKYRQWKPVLVPPLAALALFLLNRNSEVSADEYCGIGISILLGLAYLVEEIVWMAQGRGRPCPSCGQRVHLKAFSVQLSCPHCGKAFE
jgi:hypothetical protein